jgi:hypothetical protein
MKKAVSRKPPAGAPEGTMWFGGPVDRWKVALRVYGEELDPDRISALPGCEPSSAARKGSPFPRKGRWILEIDSKDCDENDDLDDGVRMLLARLPSDSDVGLLWRICIASMSSAASLSRRPTEGLESRQIVVGSRPTNWV